MVAEKIAPVQGFSAGIPWSMHLRAYDAYCKAYGPQPAMIDLEGRNCRGGFGVVELDRFIPGWRDELSALKRLEARVKALEAALRLLIEEIIDREGREGMTDYDFAEQVIALAQRARETLTQDVGLCVTTGQAW